MDNSIKELIKASLREGCRNFKKIGISGKHLPPIFISQPKRKEWGDLSTNLPFLLQKESGKDISKIGKLLVSWLENEDFLARAEFISPGFINLFIAPSYLKQTIKKIIVQKEKFPRFSFGNGKRVQVEFVSANPTGPLHVGHGRAAALGDSLANILEKAGYKIEREYYINDVGSQIERLARSVWARLQEVEGAGVPFPNDGYKGLYLIDIAKEAKDAFGEKLKHEESKQKLFDLLGKFTVAKILKEIKKDLDEFGVRFDRWFKESSLYENGEIPRTISSIKDRGYVYEKGGALWFKTSPFLKDEEDRVLKRKSGEYTYFASDIAYHRVKFSRGLHQVIDIWGADHIGYVPRMKAAIQALGYPEGSLQVIIYQFVNLKRGEKSISASTREGEFVSLRDVLREVGRDVARFFFLSRTQDSHLDFDLDLAKKQSPENPVFYIQYAYARICSILRKAESKGITINNLEEAKLDLLVAPEERELMRELALLPDQVREAAESLEPHRLTTYLQELASLFHQFYTRHRVISKDKDLTFARLTLIKAVKLAIKDVLGLLGISAPQKM
ncbi:MAG: arginine--tRNA ligase [Candidatus Aerophobetes bacterium]|nr:arginine--tRNA ligase [Candidatus Aerophobetes bacterium]